MSKLELGKYYKVRVRGIDYLGQAVLCTVDRDVCLVPGCIKVALKLYEKVQSMPKGAYTWLCPSVACNGHNDCYIDRQLTDQEVFLERL